MFPDRFRKHFPLLVFLAVILCYFSFIGPLIQSNGVWINDEGNRLLHIDAFAYHDGYLPDPMNGAVLPGLSSYAPDKYLVREPGTNKVISAYTPAFPFLMSFPYRIGNYPLCRFAVILFAWICVGLTGYILSLSGSETKQASFGMVLAGLCTPLFFYSGTLLELTLAAMLAAGVFLLIRLAVKQETLWYWSAAGLVCSLIPWFREEGYVLFLALALSLMIFQWEKNKVWCAFCIPCLLGISVLLLFNYTRTGVLFGLHHLIYEDIRTEPKTIFSILKSTCFFLYQPNMHGLTALLCGILFAVCTFFGFIPDRIRGITITKTILFYLLVAATLWNTAFLLVMPNPVESMLQFQSLAATTPFVFIPLLFAHRFLTDRDLFRKILFAVCFLALIGISLNLEYCNRGMFFGARHFLVILPAFAMLTVWTADYIVPARKWIRPACVALCLLALFCQFYGVRLLNLRKQASQNLIRTCQHHNPPLIVTDVFFLPEELASLHEKPPVLYVTDEGVRIFSALMDYNHVNSFLFLTAERFASGTSLLPHFAKHWEIRQSAKTMNPMLNFMNIHFYILTRKTEHGNERIQPQ